MNALIQGRLATGAASPEIGVVGHSLSRPECVLATASGDLYVSDWRGGVCHLLPDGHQHFYTGTVPDGIALKPNGIALLSDGAFLLAHLGINEGGVYRLDRSGQMRPWLQAVEGVDLPPTNFVAGDASGRHWITVSTRLRPRARAYRQDVSDGFIVLVDRAGARVVADGLGYANEVAVHPDGRWLYVNETFARRLSRFALHADGSLGRRETVTEFGAGVFPDGLAFDEEGCAWVVSIVSNRLIRVAPDGAQTVWLDDSDADHVARVEAAYQNGTMARDHLDRNPSRTLRNISSIAFAGSDRRTAVLGCLLGETLVTLQMPAPGVEPAHWRYPQTAA